MGNVKSTWVVLSWFECSAELQLGTCRPKGLRCNRFAQGARDKSADQDTMVMLLTSSVEWMIY